MVRLYMDVQVPAAITSGLRLRGADVLTAQEDGTAEMADPDLLDRAAMLNRVLFTQDKDFLKEGAERQERDTPFAGWQPVPPLAPIGRASPDNFRRSAPRLRLCR